MHEFELRHVETYEMELIFGYNLADAFRRNPQLNPNDWECVSDIYID